jgi:epsilon-lactone hydrolase
VPTLQHAIIRRTLGTIVGIMRGAEFKIPTVRKLADVGSFIFFMPHGVETESFRLDHIDCEWIIPKKANHNKVFLFLHGGGYAMGSKQTHRALLGEIVRQAGFCGLIPEYRLAPEFPFPSAVEDALRCYEWLLETGHSPKDIVIGGDSAGGGLAVATLLAARDKGLPMPSAQILIAPWVDLTVSQPSIFQNVHKSPMLYLREMKAWARNYAGDAGTKHPLVSPIFADLTGLPPMLMQLSDDEVLVDEDTLLAENARNAGVKVEFEVWHEMIHVWHIYWRYLDQARDAIKSIVRFVGEHSGS